MNDREEWRERVKDIRATSAIWWWWWYIRYTRVRARACARVCVCRSARACQRVGIRYITYLLIYQFIPFLFLFLPFSLCLSLSQSIYLYIYLCVWGICVGVYSYLTCDISRWIHDLQKMIQRLLNLINSHEDE